MFLNRNGSVQGSWTASANWNWVVDPLNGEKFIKIAEINGNEIKVLFSSISMLHSRKHTFNYI
jgi:1-pyrroline-5-carboxylate dehydrogenase